MATCFARCPRACRSARAASDGGPSSNACCVAVAPGHGPGCCPPPQRDARPCAAACPAVRCAPFRQPQVNPPRGAVLSRVYVCVPVRACCGPSSRRRGAVCVRLGRHVCADTPHPSACLPADDKTEQLLKILVCPLTKSPLTFDRARCALACAPCTFFPLRVAAAAFLPPSSSRVWQLPPRVLCCCRVLTGPGMKPAGKSSSPRLRAWRFLW